MTSEQRILMAAAGFIRKHPNGTDDSLKELMAATVEDCAKRLESQVGVAKQSILDGTWAVEERSRAKKNEPVPYIPEAKMAVVSGVSEENARILLRAAGYKTVKGGVLETYRVLLSDSSRPWSSEQVAKIIKKARSTINGNLMGLAKRGAITRTNVGWYRAT